VLPVYVPHTDDNRQHKVTVLVLDETPEKVAVAGIPEVRNDQEGLPKP
jgi:hypothetical protein